MVKRWPKGGLKTDLGFFRGNLEMIYCWFRDASEIVQV